MDKNILYLTIKFHDTYEALSKEFGYETREDTKQFDVSSANGKLMYATVETVCGDLLKKNEQLKIQVKELNERLDQIEEDDY